MNGFFKFSLWIVALGIGIKFYQFTGLGVALTCGGIWLVVVLCIWSFKKKKEENPEAVQIDAEMFKLPLLGKPVDLLAAPELERTIINNEYNAVTCKRSIIVLMAILSILMFFGLGAFNSDMLIMCGIIGCALVLTNKLGQVLFKRKRIKYLLALERQRNLFLSLHPRPVFDINDLVSLNHFCRYYETLPEALIAVNFVKLANIDYLIYPGDSMRMICGTHYERILEQMKKLYGIGNFEKTLRETINRNTDRPWAVILEQIPEPLDPLPEPPPTAYKLTNPSKLQKELEKRPLFDLKTFCSYWPTREEAAVALTIKEILVEGFDGPGVVFYPNDTLVMMFSCCFDSLDSIEFIMSLEEQFKISISDKDAEKLHTFGELVRYVVKKQKETIRRPAE